MSDWIPVAHEDIEDESPASRDPEARRQGGRGQPTAIPMGLSVLIPPELIEGITALVEGQEGMAKRLDAMADALTETLADFREEIAQARGDATLTAERSGQAMEARFQGHAESIAAVMRGQQEVSATIQAMAETVARAVTAPRVVSLQRDKDGRAVGATSEVAVH